jgi:hypothetical protein
VTLSGRLPAKKQNTMNNDDQQFLEFVVKGLVDHPEAVKVDRTVDEMGVLLTLDVNHEDMGKIIGRSGNTAKAIRTLLRVVGMKNNARVNLKINEPEGGLRSPTGGAPVAAVAPVQSEAARSLDEAMADLKLD